MCAVFWKIFKLATFLGCTTSVTWMFSREANCRSSLNTKSWRINLSKFDACLLLLCINCKLSTITWSSLQTRFWCSMAWNGGIFPFLVKCDFLFTYSKFETYVPEPDLRSPQIRADHRHTCLWDRVSGDRKIGQISCAKFPQAGRQNWF